MKDKHQPENITPFLDYEGKANPENVAKINYYKELNRSAMQKRMNIRHGESADPSNKIWVGPNSESALRMIPHLGMVKGLSIFDKLQFSKSNLERKEIQFENKSVFKQNMFTV